MGLMRLIGQMALVGRGGIKKLLVFAIILCK